MRKEEGELEDKTLYIQDKPDISMQAQVAVWVTSNYGVTIVTPNS